ncbi:hypothetical protein AB0903_30580 [Streptomyces sp. NPDC048389]|uniref:WXG100 family type VII secretion target n=1 Tax=Streptomyces sp. NPDC048389 TaxID=3154622 RepID=UPI0034513CD3
MSHEAMLAWLDQASSFHVQEAADRLSAAAVEIRSIAQQMKFRPERVRWEGEGFEAFVEWGASLASSTLRLADYSDDASKWLGQSSGAIARAQAAIPRYTSKEQAQANLAAAQAHRNDPDASAVAAEADSALAATREQNRLEAAAEMRKLAQAYDQSASQMDKLEPPTFRPPPAEFVPPPDSSVGTQDLYHSERATPAGGGGGGGYAAPASATGGSPVPGTAAARMTGPELPPGVTEPRPPQVAMELDSVNAQPPKETTPPAPSSLGPLRPEGGPTNPPVNLAPPVPGGGPLPPPAKHSVTERIPGIPRGPVPPGQSTGVPGPGPGSARPPKDGIVGGRPMPPASAQASGIPRGNVIGAGGGGYARPPMAHGAVGVGGGAGSGQSRTPGGRRFATETGGIVGGRPQTGVTGGRPSTEGGSRPAPGGITGTPSRPSSRNENTEGDRPDYLTEDDETWHRNNRRVVPPVID